MPYIISTEPDIDGAEQAKTRPKGSNPMGIFLKLIGILLILGIIGLIGFAYLGDLTPDQKDVRQPVQLNAD